MTEKRKRGFALLSADRVKELARMGGFAAQVAGKAHRWSTEEARELGMRAAMRARENSRSRRSAAGEPPPEPGCAGS